MTFLFMHALTIFSPPPFFIPFYSLPSSLFAQTFIPFFPPMHGRRPVIFVFGLACFTEHVNPQFYSFPATNLEFAIWLE